MKHFISLFLANILLLSIPLSTYATSDVSAVETTVPAETSTLEELNSGWYEPVSSAQPDEISNAAEDDSIVANATGGVNLVSKSISLGSNLGVNFKLTVPDSYIPSSFMTFTVHGRSSTIYTADLEPDEDGNFIFTCYVTSIEMAEQISAVFTYGTNTLVTSYSVAEYIEAYETASVNYAAVITNLVQALADFGHHAQTFLSSYRSWSIGTDYAEISGVTPGYSSAEMEIARNSLQDYTLSYTSNPDISAVNISLNLESETSIYVYATPSADYTGSVTCSEGYAVEKIGNKYRVTIPGIMAHQLGDTYTLHITTSSGTSVVNVSALSYADRIFKNEAMGSDAHAFAVSLYNYYLRSRAYIENPPTSTTYRALLIGEENFNPTCVRNRGDVVLMTNMLNSVTGALGGAWNITQDFDLSPTQVQQAISTAFADADEDDISLFFIATHGDTKSEGSHAGALQTVDSSGTTGWIFFENLASWLNAIPGKVIVIIESCGSGAALYEEGVDENSFNEAVINAFKTVETSGLVPNRVGSQIVYDPQTGELRNDKFRVLTASRYQQESYGYESGDIDVESTKEGGDDRG